MRLISMEKGTYMYIASDSNRRILVPHLCEHVLIASWKLKAGLENLSENKIPANIVLYYEYHATAEQALMRVLLVKNYNHEKRLALVKEQNPQLKDLYYEMWTAG